MTIDYAEMLRAWEQQRPAKCKPRAPLTVSKWPNTEGRILIGSASQFIEAVPGPCPIKGCVDGWIQTPEGSARCENCVHAARVADRINRLRAPLSHEMACAHAVAWPEGQTSNTGQASPSQSILTLHGLAMSGKSYRAACLVLYACLCGESARWVTMEGLGAEVREGFDVGRSELATLRPYMRCGLLVLDDVREATEHQMRCMSWVLRERCERMLRTIITTPLEGAALLSQFDKAAATRISRMGRREPMRGHAA